MYMRRAREMTQEGAESSQRFRYLFLLDGLFAIRHVFPPREVPPPIMNAGDSRFGDLHAQSDIYALAAIARSVNAGRHKIQRVLLEDGSWSRNHSKTALHRNTPSCFSSLHEESTAVDHFTRSD